MLRLVDGTDVVSHPDPAREEQPLVRASSLVVRYRRLEVLRGVDLTVRPGAQLALTGRSGSGKSTLLLVLAGLLAPSTGRSTWPGLAAGPAGPSRADRYGVPGALADAAS